MVIHLWLTLLSGLPIIRGMKVTITQQALNVIRQLVNAKGWPSTLAEAYVGGKLIAKYLPEPDPISGWAKTDYEVKNMTPAELEVYQALDKAWVTKQFELDLTDKQVAAIKQAFLFFIDELIKTKNLGPNPVFVEIVDVFGIDLEDKA